MDLRPTLDAQTLRSLWAIAQARGLNPGRSPARADLVALVEADLRDPTRLARDVATLPLAERHALDLLLAAGAPLPLSRLALHFGDVRPYRPWRDDSPAHPWLDPSPLERLVYLGLAYLTRAEVGGWGAEACLLVPGDLAGRLPRPPSPAEQARLPADPSGGPPPLPTAELLHDCFTFLSFLNCHDLAPRHRRWLTPRQFRPLNDRFCRPEPLQRAGRPILGEKNLARLRFVHYLLEAAGLIALAGEYLKPAPPALTWLDDDPFRRLRSLWQPWSDPEAPRQFLWREFDLPSLSLPSQWPLEFARPPLGQIETAGKEPDLAMVEVPAAGRDRAGSARPLAAVHRLLAALRHCRPGEVYDLDLFVAALCLQDMDFYLRTPGLGLHSDSEDRSPTAPRFLREMLTHILRWFGLLALYGDRQSPTAFSLTPAGAALLGAADPPPSLAAPPVAHTRHGAVLTLSPIDLSVDAGPGCPPALLYRLEPWVEWLAVRRYRLLPAAVQRALQRGGCLDDLLQVLAEGCAAPLPPDVAGTLRDWAAAGQAITLRRPVLLQTHSRALLDELAARPAVRGHFRETLSPRHVVVDERGLEALLRALRQLGHAPHLALPLPLAEDGALPPPARGWSPGDDAYLLLAARVFNGLARLIRPLAAVPAPVLDALAARLDERGRESAEQLAAETLARLVAALDGWTPHGPYQAALPLADSRPVVEQAIAAGLSLDLDYWTAGREELTHRVVDPLRIEERAGVPYLVAWCHLRGAERVFRLDRIAAIQIRGETRSGPGSGFHG